MIVTSLSVARGARTGYPRSAAGLALATWQIFVGKAVPALIVATLQATIVLAIGIWPIKIPFAGSLLLFYFTMVIYGLSLVGFGLLISSLLRHPAAGVYRRVRLYDAGDPAFGLRFTGGKYAAVAAGSDLDKPIRHFTDITKQIYLKDASLKIVWGSLWPLLVIAATTGSAAYAMFRRKIA
ncbi:ABC transporter membrane protein [Klebsiella variicola]|uniref:ABC transporter membrane protein n=1 Tax=Klebsiella variicola TaxID=244366 RepID=A0A7H4MG82_KLEVA|nr:ABC transporter membrane protein [Klebsiella variicola]